MCEAMQLQHGLVRIEGAKDPRGTNPNEMNEFIKEKKRLNGNEDLLKWGITTQAVRPVPAYLGAYCQHACLCVFQGPGTNWLTN